MFSPIEQSKKQNRGEKTVRFSLDAAFETLDVAFETLLFMGFIFLCFITLFYAREIKASQDRVVSGPQAFEVGRLVRDPPVLPCETESENCLVEGADLHNETDLHSGTGPPVEAAVSDEKEFPVETGLGEEKSLRNKTKLGGEKDFRNEINPPNQATLAEKSEPLTGEDLSFNFQDIEIRAALQLLADFAGFNLIASDSVKGNITIRLQKVPWEQALDIILRTKGLEKRQIGNVMLIGPTEEIVAREKMESERLQHVNDLEPMHSEIVQLNYAKAEDLKGLLTEKGNAIMSPRGNVTLDKRTNRLLIQDIPKKLVGIKTLIRELDIPIRQVEISTQIVTADDTLEEVLGVRFGGAAPMFQTAEGLLSDLPAAVTTTTFNPGKVGLALARLPHGILIDLELQALEYESKIKTISRPKITTTDKTKAFVEQGFEIPYLEASSSGATHISFKKAVLRLEVTPQITPDNKLILDLLITNDTPQNITALVSGVPSPSTGTQIGLKTTRLSTQVLLDNGETIVLGGVLTFIDTKKRAKIPIFGDIPLLGVIFRNKDVVEERKEVLIFITPRLVDAP